MEFIKKYKSSLIVFIIFLILMILMSLVIKFMFMSNGNKYGNRLKDAPIIEEKIISNIKTTIINNDFVNDFKYELNSVTIRIFIDVKENTKLELSKGLASVILDNLDSKIKNFYDVELYVTQNNGKDSCYPIIGYHSKNSDEFSWVINQGETNEK